MIIILFCVYTFSQIKFIKYEHPFLMCESTKTANYQISSNMQMELNYSQNIEGKYCLMFSAKGKRGKKYFIEIRLASGKMDLSWLNFRSLNFFLKTNLSRKDYTNLRLYYYDDKNNYDFWTLKKPKRKKWTKLKLNLKKPSGSSKDKPNYCVYQHNRRLSLKFQLRRSKKFFIMIDSMSLTAPPRIEIGDSLQESFTDVIFFNHNGLTYAQVASYKISYYLKDIENIDMGVGDVITKGKAYKVIQYVIDMLEKFPKVNYKLYFKRGIYDLSNRSISFSYYKNYEITGEGFDINEPDEKNLRATYFIYSGNDTPFKWAKLGGHNKIVIRDLTIVLKKPAKYGLLIGGHPTYGMVSNVSVISEHNAEAGLFYRTSGDNQTYFRNIFIHGPFDVGLRVRADWPTVINVDIRGFKKRAITGAPVVIGGIFKHE